VFNSLRIRLVAAFVLIIAITLLTAGLTLYARLGSYRDDLTQSTLQQVAAPVYYNLTLYPGQAQRGGVLREELAAYLRVQAEDSNLILLLIDGSGQAIVDDGAHPELNDETFIVPPPPERGPNFESLPQQEYTLSEGDRILYVIVPMPRAFRTSPASIHGILVALPDSTGRDVFRDLFPRLLLAGTVGLAAATLAALLLSASIFGPLSRVRGAIRAIAGGDYRQRVPETGPHEVRSLASNVNTMAGSVQASQRTLREFLANVGHELKTPLTSIRGFAGAMSDGTLSTDAERQRALRVIDAESRRVLHLVEELLDLSRIESGQQEMKLAPVSLPDLLAHVAEVFSMRAEETGVSLVVVSAPSVVLSADFDRLEQVLGNLLDNAFRHARTGGRIELGASAPRAGLVELYVADDGDGIPPADLPHVFDRLYRGEIGGPGRPGSGLGLTISREIARAHGGELRAESPPAGGARFTLTLPTSPSQQPSGRAAPSRREHPPAAADTAADVT
jgi:signal transduction histidine kinase